jgi:hypothetical protein
MDVKFPKISPGTTTVVALESVGSKTMNRTMKSASQGEFDGIPSWRDQQKNEHSKYNHHQRSIKKTTLMKMS